MEPMIDKLDGLVQLIEKARDGDEIAFQELCVRFEPLIISIVRRTGCNDREDVKQELLAELFHAIQRFTPIE